MTKLLNNIRFKFEYLAHKKFFNEIYVAIFAAITVICWKFNSMLGLEIFLGALFLVVVFLDDLKYAIPILIFFLFNINFGFANNEVPKIIIYLVADVVLCLVYFTIKSGIHLKKMKSFIPLLGLSISQIIPIFWTAITVEYALYYIYFANLLYLVYYIVIVNGIKKGSLDILATTMSYLGVLVACQCIIKVYEIKPAYEEILNLWYYLGWGLCNEAGIMICLSIPFSFYLISKSNQARVMFLHNLKIVVSIAGIILTTSRGSYLFGFSETAILYIVTFFLSKDKFKYFNFIVYFLSILLITFAIFGTETIKFYNDVIEKVFLLHLDDNGRVSLWKDAYHLYMQSPKTIAFGPGVVAEIKEVGSAYGNQPGWVAYHSTLFETMAMGGVFGLFFLACHFANHYSALIYTNKRFMIIIGLGSLFIDAYGMIDNSYYMIYYMLPLYVILACIDNKIYDKTQIDWQALKSKEKRQLSFTYGSI